MFRPIYLAAMGTLVGALTAAACGHLTLWVAIGLALALLQAQPMAWRRMFFSEEKNQKTFISPPLPNFPAMAGNFPRTPEQKSFGSFLQKRTFFS